MNENTKTVSFVALGALALVIGWWSIQRPDPAKTEIEEGVKLFEKFSDPLAAKTLDIVQFDEATASVRPFQIAQVGGLWSIPSHQNYPSDARDHLAAAATSVIDLSILGKVSDSPGDQELYGVIEPDIKTLKPGMVGVGTRVTLKDDKGEPLADFIIGKEVKDKPELRYIRKTGKDQIFTVAIKTDKLSTKFEDWIERDLLKFNAADLRQVQLNDYSIEEQLDQEGLGLANVQRSKIQLAYEEDKSTWKVLDIVDYKKGEAVPAELGEDEELNTEKLNGLKTALGDLKIVDVEKKPKGLSQDLKATEEFVKKNVEAINSLASRGYYPVKLPDGKLDVLSSEGEVIARMKDGVQYVLRFGQIAATEKGDEKSEEGKDKDAKGAQLNRYLFVSAKFDPEMIPKPKLEPIPGQEKPAEAAEPAAEGDAAAVPETKTAQKAAAKDDGKKGAAPATPPADPSNPDAPVADAPAKAEPDAAKPDAAKAEPAAEQSEEDKAKAEQAAKDKLELIKKDNKRKQDDYDSKVKKGEEHVKELNARFADWYYVISDETYRKIHLGRADIVKKKEKPAGEGDTVNDLKELEKGLKGLKK